MIEVILRQLKVGDGDDFVPSLIVDRDLGPVGVGNEYIGRLKIQIEFGLHTSGWESYIIVQNSRKCFVGKVVDPRISDRNGGINIVQFLSRVASIVDGELPEFGDVLPVTLVCESLISRCKAHLKI